MKTLAFKGVYPFFVYKHGLFDFCIPILAVDSTDVGGPLFIPPVEFFTVVSASRTVGRCSLSHGNISKIIIFVLFSGNGGRLSNQSRHNHLIVKGQKAKGFKLPGAREVFNIISLFDFFVVSQSM